MKDIPIIITDGPYEPDPMDDWTDEQLDDYLVELVGQARLDAAEGVAHDGEPPASSG